MLAEIFTGERDTSDLFLLVALLLFVLAAVVSAAKSGELSKWAAPLAYIGLASTALALMLL